MNYLESFETSLGNWVSSGYSGWRRDSDGTPSGSTGPSAAYSGSYYVYVETSSGGSNVSGITDYLTYPFPTANPYSGSITFYYNQYGIEQGTLSVETLGSDGSTWTPQWSSSGDQGTSWKTATISFADAYDIRFKNVASGGYRGDVALDYITVDAVEGVLRIPIPDFNIKVSGTYRSAKGMNYKLEGVWRTIIDVFTKVNGAWNVFVAPIVVDRLYHCDSSADKIYELNIDTKASISNVSSPGAAPYGVGGINDRLYHCDYSSDKNYELNIDTLATINTVSSPSSRPSGIGGISNRLYHCDAISDKIYELNIDTKASISNVSSPSGISSGIGGVK